MPPGIGFSDRVITSFYPIDTLATVNPGEPVLFNGAAVNIDANFRPIQTRSTTRGLM
ncbi:MAG: hypothetical protein LH613_14950 [Chamaesiphon sp.]|nr:hypothetical protein [Chamaesiphon sp.]